MSTESADPATSRSESTVDIMAAVIAASRIAPSVAGRTAVASIGIARSPVGRFGKSTTAASESTKTIRFRLVTAMMVSRMPRRMVRMSRIA